jgi:DNA-binding response OmpR family regulator
MNLLIIDDEKPVIAKLKKDLKPMSWKIDTASSYECAIKHLLDSTYDVIVCDHYFPQEPRNHQGLDIVREMRRNNIQTPVLILTGCDIGKIKPWEALDVGVDDFLRKPYYPEEIIARLKALARRTFRCQDNSTNRIVHDGLIMDFDVRKTYVNGHEIHLTGTLFHILKKFMQNIGIFISYEDFIKDIWGESALFQSGINNTLRVHMRYLRKALGEDYGNRITTIHGRGFIFEEEKEEVGGSAGT